LAWMCLRIRLKILRWWWRVPTAVLSLLEPVPVYVVRGPLKVPLEFLLPLTGRLRVDASGQVKDADGVPLYVPGTGPQGFELYRERFYSVYPFVTVPGMEFILRERKIAQPVTDFYDNSYVQALQNANFAATVAKSI
jgi:hypothetical protein